MEKMEAVILTNINKYYKINVSFRNHQIESQPSLHYLEVQLDTILCYVVHVELAEKRVNEVQKQLVDLMPNTRSLRQGLR